jgi:hypothetical protein
MIGLLEKSVASYHHTLVVHSILEAQNLLEKADKETLILIDVDSTLTTPTDPYLRRAAIHQYRAIYNAVTFGFTPNQRRIFDHVLVTQSPSRLVENVWPHIIKNLQNKGIMILALTAAKMGPLPPLLDHFPDWRYQQLKELGIDFSPIFPGSILFKDLEDWGGEHPGIEKGIIYSGHKIKKGEILPHVLSTINFSPTYIIFIDDKEDNIRSVSSTIQEKYPHVKFLGIHYKGLENVARPAVDEPIFSEKFHRISQITKNISS